MLNKNIHDFDMFWKEKEKQPIEFKVFGKGEKIPPSLPAIVMLKLLRAQKEFGNKELPEHIILDLSFGVFGEEKVDEWAKNGLSVDELGDMIKWAMQQYNPGKDDNGEVKN